jgi:hypothetical protein
MWQSDRDPRTRPAYLTPSTWSGDHTRICQSHPDLVAVYESNGGTLGLLLDQTMAPPAEGRRSGRAVIQRAARPIIDSLRAAGLHRKFVVLQQLALEHATRILRHWTRRYDGDPARRNELERLAVRLLADRPAIARRATRERRASGPEAPWENFRHVVTRPELTLWYRDMAPIWLSTQPLLRRLLILRTQRWIIDRLVEPVSRGEEPSMTELRPRDTLEAALDEMIPADEFDEWRPWIRLVVSDLGHALACPVAGRDDTWMRRLFLIPYRIPVRARRSPSCRQAVRRPVATFHPMRTAEPAGIP